MRLITQNLTPAEFFANGGMLEYEVDASEVDEGNPNFHQLPTIKPLLLKGFELPPAEVFHDPKALAQMILYAGAWTKMIYKVYEKGGKIIYTQINPKLYRAVCTL
ncbi:hypothetical protein HNS13_21290 [Escherichia coli]|uniref:hypothetical protein n=1 Tax=Escherichia coli TaxID=562 RepID=UPI0017CEF6FC|nr:hypothetical protein [Escherichia coli]EFA4269496.1 hypothetical protein [Escherichia coli O8]EFH8763302.1 hypothetical protein [Escherichia coli]EGH4615679.1 hypothetical protein [Escherichia coli]MCR2868262.1 hypothetical protein [Escherichia coli]MCR2883111.1 hypothetical protein [Escherichia coli]